MSKILPFILTTLIGFVVGIGAGIWMNRTPAIPPPPAGILDELKDAPINAQNPPPAYDAQREQAFQQIRAEMDDFRKKVDDIKKSLRSQMEPILTPEQRERMSRWRERPGNPPPPPTTTPPGGRHNFWEGFESAMTIMMVPFSLERMNESLNFTPGQKATVHRLLLERRAKFLDLVDTTPPPSFKVLKFAPPEAKTKTPDPATK